MFSRNYLIQYWQVAALYFSLFIWKAAKISNIKRKQRKGERTKKGERIAGLPCGDNGTGWDRSSSFSF